MTIYELEKQATPGRFEHRGEGTVAIAGGRHVFILYSGATKQGDESLAELVCHCRNNFLKALEALKAEHAESCIVLAARVPEADAIRCCGTCALIKEMEEVEI